MTVFVPHYLDSNEVSSENDARRHALFIAALKDSSFDLSFVDIRHIEVFRNLAGDKVFAMDVHLIFRKPRHERVLAYIHVELVDKDDPTEADFVDILNAFLNGKTSDEALNLIRNYLLLEHI